MSQIEWRGWSDTAFADAQTQNKPVLLAIVAPWCQFCRNMDEQTYSNEAIAQYVGDNFIPVRVNSDERPDINSRYTVGGWPTTSILTPEGDVLWTGGFVPADGMAQLLPQLLNAFRNDKRGVAQQVAQQREQIARQTTMPPLDTTLQPSPEISQIILMGVKQSYDFAFAGFGKEQKFANTDALEFLMALYNRAASKDNAEVGDVLLMLVRTLGSIINGSLHDHFAGGFFRYTQRPDWQEPRYEKLLDENANILRVFAHAHQLFSGTDIIAADDALKTVGEKAKSWIDNTLWDNERGIWFGSQAADDEYYSQPLDERAEWNPPAVDTTILAGANALSIRAHVAWWAATGDTDALNKAKRAADFLRTNLKTGDGSYAHALGESESDAPHGLLGDNADICAANLDLYEAGLGVVYLDEAEAIALWTADHLEDPASGGLYDLDTDTDAPGNLKIATKDLTDNMQMTDALLRLYLATGEEKHAHLATRTLQAFLPAVGQVGFFAVPVALAAERAMTLPAIVHVLGASTDPRTTALIHAAHTPYRYARLVQALDPTVPEDAEHIANLEHPIPVEPVAYLSVGTKAYDPITDPTVLAQTVREATA